MLGALMYFLIWAPLNILRRVYWRWTVDGLENLPPKGTGIVLSSNHLNWLDIIVIGASLPLSHRPQWIAKAELYKQPVVGWWLRTMGAIPIQRGRRDLAALGEAEQALQQGAIMIIFPEGHRSKTGGLQEGRGGAVRLAANGNAVVLPTAIWGTEKGFGGLMRRNPVHIRFGPAYTPEVPGATIPADVMRRLTDDMMLKIAMLLPNQYRGFYAALLDDRMRRQSVGAPD